MPGNFSRLWSQLQILPYVIILSDHAFILKEVKHNNNKKKKDMYIYS